MYCKNCGRQLKEGARFCDRCGQSVRQNNQPSEREIRRRKAETLQEERLNRKKRIEYKEERESRKKEKKKARKNRNFILIFIFLILILALVSAIISYHMNVSDSDTPLGEIVTETVPPATPAPTMIVNTIPASEQTAKPQNENSGLDKNDNNAGTAIDSSYEAFNVNNIICPYPKGFASKSLSGNEKLSLTDPLGGASMTICVEDNVTAPTTDLMRDYAAQTGGQIIDSRAVSTGFSVTAERDNIVYHRKGVLEGNSIVYYDFQYATGSSKASQYAENIKYIDSVMNGSNDDSDE